MKYALLIILSMMCFSAHARLNPFTSDGCSKWMDGSILDPHQWRDCCFQHDISYWMGGTKKEKEAADSQLAKCVGETGAKTMGLIMEIGVAIGGGPGYHTSYRWGYGWTDNRGYRPLTEKEKTIVVEELSHHSFVGKERAIIKRAVQQKGLLPYLPDAAPLFE
jgi:hypothetical protein